METIKKLNCPNCGTAIDIDEVLIEQFQDKIKKELEAKHKKKELELQKKLSALQNEKDEIEKAKENLNDIINKQVQDKVKNELPKLKKSIRQEIEDQNSEYLKELTNELNEKSEQLRELNKTKAEIERLKREKKEIVEEIKLQKEKEFAEKLREVEKKATKKVEEESLLKINELKKQLEDQKKLAAEMKRKAEQGSIQLQGEVQELALEDLLSSSYPFDKIQEVPKGVKGADCIQIVINSMQQECGSIVYESKRTKNFSNNWIDKLKQDQITCKADIAVIVTETLPSDMDRFGEKDGVWICSFNDVKSLSFVLREMLIKTHSVKVFQENKGEKMELLYNYFTSNEFVQNIKRIVEVYGSMIDQLNSEKKAMLKIWAQREKQIWIVQENISALFGSIKGIAGKELKTSNVLELPDKKIDE